MLLIQLHPACRGVTWRVCVYVYENLVRNISVNRFTTNIFILLCLFLFVLMFSLQHDTRMS